MRKADCRNLWEGNKMSEPIVVLMTAGSQEEAERIARTLVTEMLCACVNVVPGVTSVYRWEGKVQHDQEWLLIAKTRHDVLEELITRVQALHSYDVPEIIALPVTDGSKAYLRWLDGKVHGNWHALD
jgi:periplasmic divalent cation tolerance protein